MPLPKQWPAVCYSWVVTYFIAFRLTREGIVLAADEMYCSEDEARERARD
jgi:hypothetical protein